MSINNLDEQRTITGELAMESAKNIILVRSINAALNNPHITDLEQSLSFELKNAHLKSINEGEVLTILMLLAIAKFQDVKYVVGSSPVNRGQLEKIGNYLKLIFEYLDNKLSRAEKAHSDYQDLLLEYESIQTIMSAFLIDWPNINR